MKSPKEAKSCVPERESISYQNVWQPSRENSVNYCIIYRFCLFYIAPYLTLRRLAGDYYIVTFYHDVA